MLTCFLAELVKSYQRSATSKEKNLLMSFDKIMF